jgi:hypothetical protein
MQGGRRSEPCRQCSLAWGPPWAQGQLLLTEQSEQLSGSDCDLGTPSVPLVALS